MNTQTNIQRFNWSAAGMSDALANALRAVGEHYSQIEENGTIGRTLEFKTLPSQDGQDISRVSKSGSKVLIECSSIATALRGVGTALGNCTVDESTSFTRLGIMLDCSRGRVPTVKHLKLWLTRLALMGYTYALLYCEDTYQLPDEPFFGYMRGGYTMAELKELDDFAACLGIELIGCVELLGHMAQILKWPAYVGVKDTISELLIDEPKTEALIEKIISFWSQALRSRCIHIGMDETHNMLRGHFLDNHGVFGNPFEYFNKHLALCDSICHKHGLQPMIWSDMYFRLENPKHEYYHCRPVPPEVANHIPADVQLVYWDYYNKDVKTYREMIKRHQEMGFQPILGSGCWAWNGSFWYDHKRTIETVVPGLAAARECKVNDVFFTLWGDDGCMCDMDSILAGLARCADLAYGAKADDESMTSEKFSAICKSNYDGAVLAASINPAYTRADGRDCNLFVSALLFDDPLLGMVMENFEAALPGEPANYLHQLDVAQNHLRHFRTQSCGDFVNFNNLLRLLMLKIELRLDFVKAYREKDMKTMRDLGHKRSDEVIAAAKAFLESYTIMWLKAAKPFGLEVIQDRIGGLIARLEEFKRRTAAYAAGKMDTIEELEVRPALNQQNAACCFYQVALCKSPSVWM